MERKQNAMSPNGAAIPIVKVSHKKSERVRYISVFFNCSARNGAQNKSA